MNNQSVTTNDYLWFLQPENIPSAQYLGEALPDTDYYPDKKDHHGRKHKVYLCDLALVEFCLALPAATPELKFSVFRCHRLSEPLKPYSWKTNSVVQKAVKKAVLQMAKKLQTPQLTKSFSAPLFINYAEGVRGIDKEKLQKYCGQPPETKKELNGTHHTVFEVSADQVKQLRQPQSGIKANFFKRHKSKVYLEPA